MQRAYQLKQDCDFCKILQGKDECFRVFEDQWTLTFLDRRPLFPGHCLLIPKTHVETLGDLQISLVRPIFVNVRLLARAVQEAMEADGSFVAINNHISQRVPHLHVHIVPRRKGDGLRGFFWPRRRYADQSEIDQVLQKLRKAITRLEGTRVGQRNSKSRNG